MNSFKNKLISRQRRLLYSFFSKFDRRNLELPSLNHIDVAVMVLEKDLKILPLCLEGIKKCVKNNIDDIYLISPKSSIIEDFCLSNRLTYLIEDKVLGYSPKELDIIVDTNLGLVNRSGWLFQQLVKLSGNVGKNRYTLFIDADHVLLKEHLFLTSNERTIFYMSEEYNWPYFENINKLLKRNIKCPSLSYVSHKMLFDKEKLFDLHHKIEDVHSGQSWDKTIISLYDRHQSSGFSEFELYGCLFGNNGIWKPWREKRLHYAEITDYSSLVDEYSNYMSVTFPSFYS